MAKQFGGLVKLNQKIVVGHTILEFAHKPKDAELETGEVAVSYMWSLYARWSQLFTFTANNGYILKRTNYTSSMGNYQRYRTLPQVNILHV